MWIHLQVHFNNLDQGQTGNGQTIAAGILEAKQRQKQYRAGVRAGSKTIRVPEGKITRAGGRESTVVKQSRVIHRKIRGIQGECLEILAGAKTRLRSECEGKCCLSRAVDGRHLCR